jgi:prepilin-type N-terminal cleavage/methylation domain-containing protein
MTGPTRSLRARRGRGGFTLIEVLIASALLGMSLMVMLGLHSQAVRQNMNAHRLTDCTYLAQSQMERLLAEDWSSLYPRPIDLTDAGGADPGTLTTDQPFESTFYGTPVNVAFGLDDTIGPSIYTVTWDVEDMDANQTWIRLRVRCTYPDSQFGTALGTTVSSYRYRDQ